MMKMMKKISLPAHAQNQLILQRKKLLADKSQKSERRRGKE